jgi:hypothetical protein
MVKLIAYYNIHFRTTLSLFDLGYNVGVGTGGRTRKKDYLIERKMIVLHMF